MMVPVVLVAIGAFYIYVKLNLLYTLTGLVLAHTILALPLVLIVTGSALKSYDMNQELAARGLGAPTLEGIPRHHIAANSICSCNGRVVVVPDLVRRSRNRDVYLRGRQSDPDQKYVQRPA